VKNDRPFTEMGTADYTVANELFQRDMRRMPYQMEPVVGPEWQPTHYLDGRPHAGPAVDERVLRGLGHEQHEREPAARETAGRSCSTATTSSTRRSTSRATSTTTTRRRALAVTTRADCKACHDRPGSDGVVPLPDRQRDALEEGDGTNFSDDFFSGNPSGGARRTSARPRSTACPART
jgi:hypothetical protein